MSAGSDFDPSAHEPTRALILAQALDMCIRAERDVPGSADLLIAQQPVWARPELRRLIALAGSLDAVSKSAVISDEFRVGARARLMRRIAGEAAAPPIGRLRTLPTVRPAAHGSHPVTRRGHSRWLWRGGAGGLLAATLILGATLTASANALPGNPLYSVKQAREEVGVRLAPDDQSRALALLAQANARLDETARLLDEGQTQQAAQTTQRFDDALDRATSTYVVTIVAAPADHPTSADMETQLGEQQQELQTMLQTAPEPARADLRQALVATQRSRALVADPKPVEVALGRTQSSRPKTAVAVPTVAAEAVPTTAPEHVAPAAPPPVDLVAQAPDPTPEVNGNEDDARPVVIPPVLPTPAVVVARGSQRSNARGPSKPAVVAQVQSHDDGAASASDGRDETPPRVVADNHVAASPSHADDDRGRVAEQPTPVPVAHQSSDSSSSPSVPVVAVQATHQAAQPQSQSQAQSQSHDGGADAHPQGSTSTRATTNSDSGHTATATSTSVPARTSSDGGHSTSTSSGGDTSRTSSSSGDGGHDGSQTTSGTQTTSGSGSQSGSGSGSRGH